MRLLERITLVVAVVALLSSSGCAKKVGATYDPFVLFPATAQWAWDEALNQLPDDPSITALNIRTLVRETITEGLATRGYAMAPQGGKVDFRVHYQVGLGKIIKPDSVEGYGSLSLTLVEVSTNRDVWVGFIKTDVDVSTSEAERRKRLQKEVNKMLKDFPPSQPK
jgi:hypothetical protein